MYWNDIAYIPSNVLNWFAGGSILETFSARTAREVRAKTAPTRMWAGIEIAIDLLWFWEPFHCQYRLERAERQIKRITE